MGYARYQTAPGLAGYSVEDTCHESGCGEKIDRGLAYLCGGTPGSPDEFGCGEWFCGEHLFMPRGMHATIPGGQCERCADAWRRDHDTGDMS